MFKKKDIQNLATEYKTIKQNNDENVENIKRDVVKFLVQDMNSKPDLYFLEPGHKTIHVDFTVFDNGDRQYNH